MAPRKSGLTRGKATKYKKRKLPTVEHLHSGEVSNAETEGVITPPEPAKKNGRGPGKIRSSTDVIEDRPEIWPVGNREFTCDKKPKEITAAITRLALNNMPGPLRSFHSFDDKAKDNLELAFLQRFRYREGEDTDRCREVLEAIAAKRYTEEMATARDNCIKKFGWDIQAWKGLVPHWCINPSNWHGLCDIFATEEWQRMRRQNHDNRTSSGLSVSHYAGSASAYQHFEKLDCLFLPFHVEKTLLKGEEPTMEELYLHIHCARENGISPVVAQIEAAMESLSGTNEISDGNGFMNPTTENSSRQAQAFDINSLQFTNKKTEQIYVKVKNMRADQANADMDDSTLFMSAIGGSSHGRVLGFGSKLDQKVPTATTRARHSHTTSSVSGVTQHTYTAEEVKKILEDRDRRHAEDRADRNRKQELNDMCFNQLFTMFGMQKPTLQAQGDGGEPLQSEGVIENMPNFQGQGPTSLPQSQEGALRMHMATSQGLAFALQPNRVGPFQALLNQTQTVHEVARSDAAMSQWCGQTHFNNNLSF